MKSRPMRMYGNRDINRQNVDFSRKLRSHASVIEQIAWKMLKQYFPTLKFRRQHAIDKYVLDFYCARLLLAVEFDGEQHDRKRDAFRDKFFEDRNIVTFRIENCTLFPSRTAIPEDWVKPLWEFANSRARLLGHSDLPPLC